MFARVFFYLFFLSSLVDAVPLLGNELNNDGLQTQLDQLLSWDQDGSNFKTYELNMTKKRYDIFFGLTDYHALRKYRKAQFGILGGDLLKAKFRARGVRAGHWARLNKSLKFRFKDQDGHSKIINLNTINSDHRLLDMIAYQLYQQEGLIAPNLVLSELFINGIYNGLKQRLENMDEDFLVNRQIPLGSIFRENIASSLIAFKNWYKNDYKRSWEKQTLRKEDNWEDWLAFLQVNAVDDDEVFFKYIEKYLDMDAYLKWYALTLWMSGHNNTDHNLVFINDFRYQKFRQVGYDTVPCYGNPAMPVSFFLNPFAARILTKPEYYFRVNKYIYNFLQSNSSKVGLVEIVKDSYAGLSKVLNDRLKKSSGQYKITLSKDPDAKRAPFRNHNGDVANPIDPVVDDVSLVSLESSKLGLHSFFEKRREYLLEEFDNSIVNLNFINNDKFLGDELNLAELVETSGGIEFPLSFIELVVKGGNGVKIEEIVVGLPQTFWQRGITSVNLCYDKNFNRKKDEGELCLTSE